MQEADTSEEHVVMASPTIRNPPPRWGKEEVRQPLIRPGIQSVGAVVIRGCFFCFLASTG